MGVEGEGGRGGGGDGVQTAAAAKCLHRRVPRQVAACSENGCSVCFCCSIQCVFVRLRPGLK